eukprot:CAMPEP_0184681164 /NCGR_PEP_ID=MMETSP0312-20130426/4116_1 /TAXON_ID=31354 /ORGANISM="Compsopogon coeruleus, Strain SAG 36.94" /LENGTH=266 /DNA_ID=CAMNT_0027131809 /DNA_START=736 /DNA_END=1536 /DNA_ORIENTATION=-
MNHEVSTTGSQVLLSQISTFVIITGWLVSMGIGGASEKEDLLLRRSPPWACPRFRSAQARIIATWGVETIRSYLETDYLEEARSTGMELLLPEDCPLQGLIAAENRTVAGGGSDTIESFLDEPWKVHLTPTRWKCGHCGKTFRGEWYLEKHFVRRHSSPMAENSRECFADFCGWLVPCGDFAAEEFIGSREMTREKVESRLKHEREWCSDAQKLRLRKKTCVEVMEVCFPPSTLGHEGAIVARRVAEKIFCDRASQDECEAVVLSV